jgi:hypothetical protein
MKNGLPYFKKIEIKYGFEALEKLNNFCHRGFFIFGMDFKQKNLRSL